MLDARKELAAGSHMTLVRIAQLLLEIVTAWLQSTARSGHLRCSYQVYSICSKLMVALIHHFTKSGEAHRTGITSPHPCGALGALPLEHRFTSCRQLGGTGRLLGGSWPRVPTVVRVAAVLDAPRCPLGSPSRRRCYGDHDAVMGRRHGGRRVAVCGAAARIGHTLDECVFGCAQVGRRAATRSIVVLRSSAVPTPRRRPSRRSPWSSRAQAPPGVWAGRPVIAPTASILSTSSKNILTDHHPEYSLRDVDWPRIGASPAPTPTTPRSSSCASRPWRQLRSCTTSDGVST